MINIVWFKRDLRLRDHAPLHDALAAGTFTPGQFDWVFLDGAIELSAAQYTQLEQIARLAVIVVDGAEWTVRDVAENSLKRVRTESDLMRTAS